MEAEAASPDFMQQLRDFSTKFRLDEQSQLGFVKALPLFIELWLEHSFFAALRGLFVDIFTLKQIFTLFAERTRDYFFDQGVLYGTASYIATGRSFASSVPGP